MHKDGTCETQSNFEAQKLLLSQAYAQPCPQSIWPVDLKKTLKFDNHFTESVIKSQLSRWNISMEFSSGSNSAFSFATKFRVSQIHRKKSLSLSGRLMMVFFYQEKIRTTLPSLKQTSSLPHENECLEDH